MGAERPRHVLITGGSRGLGHALALHCLSRGDVVTTCARTAMPQAHSERHRHYLADMSRESDVADLFERVRVDVGYLDVLVNNAGVASMNLVAFTTAASVQHVMATNFEGTVLATRAALRLLRHSAAGRIVNLSSVAVPLRLQGEAIYAASKAAVETFTRIVAREFAAYGITCNAVGPSPIETGLTAAVPGASMERLLAQQAIPRYATAEDFVNVVEFFLHERSSMVTGQVVYLGGIG